MAESLRKVLEDCGFLKNGKLDENKLEKFLIKNVGKTTADGLRIEVVGYEQNHPVFQVFKVQ